VTLDERSLRHCVSSKDRRFRDVRFVAGIGANAEQSELPGCGFLWLVAVLLGHFDGGKVGLSQQHLGA